MRRAQIQGISGRPKFRRVAGVATAEDRVARQFHRDQADELWVTDVTEHPTREGKVYCAVVLDAWSRRVIGWSIDGRPTLSDVYEQYVPADLVLACGIFGNVSDADVENTWHTVSMLCKPGAAIIWTRHRREPDLNRQILGWLVESGFEQLSFDAPENASLSGIGTARLIGSPLAWRNHHRFFTFVR